MTPVQVMLRPHQALRAAMMEIRARSISVMERAIVANITPATLERFVARALENATLLTSVMALARSVPMRNSQRPQYVDRRRDVATLLTFATDLTTTVQQI